MFKLNQKPALSVFFAFLLLAVGSIGFAQSNGKGAGDKELRGISSIALVGARFHWFSPIGRSGCSPSCTEILFNIWLAGRA